MRPRVKSALFIGFQVFGFLGRGGCREGSGLSALRGGDLLKRLEGGWGWYGFPYAVLQ